MFEVEKFVTVETDEEMEANDYLKALANIEFSQDTKTLFRYYRSLSDLIVFTIFWGSHPASPNILGEIMAHLGKPEFGLDRRGQMQAWYCTVVNLIGEHPEKQAAIKQMDWYVESLTKTVQF
jgi:hypothetical protein